jgi:D-aspartate ligase
MVKRTFDTSVPTIVLALARDPLPSGSTGVVRSLGRLGVPVYAAHPSRWAPPMLSRYLRGAFTLPVDASEPEKLLSALLDIGRKIARPSILIPVDDVAALFLDAHAEPLEEWFIFPEQPAGLAASLASKKELYLLCQRLRIPTPTTVFPQSRGDLSELLRSTRFPLAVKAIDPRLVHRQQGATSVVIVRGQEELLEAYERMEVDGRPNLMLQEYIPGDAASIWMFNGYFDEHSECLIAFTGTKLRQFLPDTGVTSLGICVPNAEVEQATKQMLKAVGYRGIVDLGYRYDARDGRYKLLDVNPRIGATFRLFVAGNGMDVARVMYLHLTGQQVPVSTPRHGRKWLVENYDLAASLLYRRDGRLSAGQWVRSLRGVQETAWFATDDLLPFAGMCWHSLLIVGRRLWRIATRKPASIPAPPGARAEGEDDH